MPFQKIYLDGLFSLTSQKNDNASLILAQKLQEQKSLSWRIKGPRKNMDLLKKEMKWKN